MTRGDAYQPWLRIQDLPHGGNIWRLRGVTSDRTRHILSQYERRYDAIVTVALRVLDVQAQYPLLPLEETVDGSFLARPVQSHPAPITEGGCADG